MGSKKSNLKVLTYDVEGGEDLISPPVLVADEFITVRLFNVVNPLFPCDYTFYAGDEVRDLRIQNIIKNSSKRFHFV
jgi:hypothetical protein